jgi:hypothetical protein
MEKITKRAMFEAMINGAKTGNYHFEAEEIIHFFEKELDLLDKRLANSKTNRTKKVNAENETLYNAIFDALSTEDFMPIEIILKAILEEVPDATPSRVSYQLRKMVESECVEKTEATIEGRRLKVFRKIMD